MPEQNGKYAKFEHKICTNLLPVEIPIKQQVNQILLKIVAILEYLVDIKHQYALCI